MDPYAIQFEPGEQTRTVFSVDENFLTITSRRLVMHGKNQPEQSIPFSDIASLSLEKWKDSFEEVGTLVLKLNSQEQLFSFRLSDYLDDYYARRAWPDFPAVIERIPRALCSAMQIPFLAPQLLEIEDKSALKLKGVVVKAYPRDGLAWPSQCASCLKPLAGGEAKVDTIEKTTLEGRDTSSLFSTYRLAIRTKVTFKIPYCSTCHAARFGFLKKNRAVDCISYIGVNALFDFENREYAQLFIAANQSLEAGSPTAST